MEKELSFREYFHLIQNELHKNNEKLGDIEDAAERLKKIQKSPETAFISKITSENRKSNLKINGWITKIKILPYMLIGADLSLKAIRKQIKEKCKNVSVHVIENDKAQCKWYKTVLTKVGFQVSFSHTFVDAIEYVTKNVPYIVILDLDVPAKNEAPNAFSVDQVINKIEKESPGTNIYIVSNDTNVRVLRRIKKFKSVIRTILKPLTIEKLEIALSIALEKFSR
jgi:CheY-like chemotaxis protein